MIRILLICLAFALPANAQSLDSGPVTATPWADYELSVTLFNAGDRVTAGCVMYRGQFRARLLLTARPNQPGDGAPALFGSLQETVARPINEWLAGDRDDWINAMTCARDWAARNDDPDLPRAQFAAAYEDVLAGFDGLIASVPAAAELRAMRTANGLPNR